MVLYSIVVDFSATFYCLPKPPILYGSMVLLSTLISAILLQGTTDSGCVGLCSVAVHGD